MTAELSLPFVSLHRRLRRCAKFSGSIAFVIASLAFGASAVCAKAPVVQIGKNVVKVEVASTPEQITRGLMYRTSMPEDNGMIFLFRPASGVKFWMAHCFISLDMLMIKNGRIVHIFENVPPCKSSNVSDCPTYPSADQPEILVDEVLEVNAGYSKRHGIKTGDTVTFALGNKKKSAAQRANENDKALSPEGESETVAAEKKN